MDQDNNRLTSAATEIEHGFVHDIADEIKRIFKGKTLSAAGVRYRFTWHGSSCVSWVLAAALDFDRIPLF